MLQGKAVLLCCKECEAKAIADSGKTLAAVAELRAQFDKEYDVNAKVIGFDARETSMKLELAHEKIPGLMEATQSGFSVESLMLLKGLKPGDTVRGRMRVRSGHYVLTQLERR